MNKIREYVEIAKKNLVADGGVIPVCFLGLENGESKILSPDMSDASKKQLVFYMMGIKAAQEKLKVKSLTFLGEAVMSKVDKCDKKKVVGQQDCILVSHAKNEKNQLIYVYPFSKKGNKITWEGEFKKNAAPVKAIDDNLLSFFWRGYNLLK